MSTPNRRCPVCGEESSIKVSNNHTEANIVIGIRDDDILHVSNGITFVHSSDNP